MGAFSRKFVREIDFLSRNGQTDNVSRCKQTRWKIVTLSGSLSGVDFFPDNVNRWYYTTYRVSICPFFFTPKGGSPASGQSGASPFGLRAETVSGKTLSGEFK